MDQQSAELKSPEEIERDMLHTRESISEKVAALENQVIGTAQSVTSAVSDTVEAVKSLVSNAPGAVSDTVKQSFAAVKEQLDVTGCVRRNPWESLGASAAAGFLIGYLLGGRRETAPTMAAAYQPAMAPPSRGPSESGVFDELIGMVGTEAKRLAKDAIASTSAALKQNISAGVPKLVDAAVSRVQPEPAI